MKKILSIILVLVLVLDAGASPVMFPLKSFFYGANYTRGIQIAAVNGYLSDGTNIYAGSYINVTPSGGTNPIVQLQPNDYSITFADVRTPLRFHVYDTNGVINVLTIITNGLTSYSPITFGGGGTFDYNALTNTPNLSTGKVATAVSSTNIGGGLGVYKIFTNGWYSPDGVYHPTNSGGNGLITAWRQAMAGSGGEFQLYAKCYVPAGLEYSNNFILHGISPARSWVRADDQVLYPAVSLSSGAAVALTTFTVDHVGLIFNNLGDTTIAVGILGAQHAVLSDFIIAWQGQFTNDAAGGEFIQGWNSVTAKPGMIGLVMAGGNGFVNAERGFIAGCAVDLYATSDHVTVRDVELHTASEYSNGGSMTRGNQWTTNGSVSSPTWASGINFNNATFAAGGALTLSGSGGDGLFERIHVFQSRLGVYDDGTGTTFYGTNIFRMFDIEACAAAGAYSLEAGASPAYWQNIAGNSSYFTYSAAGQFAAATLPAAWTDGIKPDGAALTFTNAAGSRFALIVNSTTNGFIFTPR